MHQKSSLLAGRNIYIMCRSLSRRTIAIDAIFTFPNYSCTNQVTHP